MFPSRGDRTHCLSRAPRSRGRGALLRRFPSRGARGQRVFPRVPCLGAPQVPAAGRPWPRGRRHLLGTAEGAQPGRANTRTAAGRAHPRAVGGRRTTRCPQPGSPAGLLAAWRRGGHSENPSVVFCVVDLCSSPLPHLVTWASITSRPMFLNPLSSGQRAQRGPSCFASYGRTR